jgi:hypothetical protein
MAITYLEICNAIQTTLAAATGLTFTQAPDKLTEGMHDWPLLQVYPEDGGQDDSGNADRSSFRAVVRQTLITIHADLYAKMRAHIGEDMAALFPLIDAIQNVIEQQDTKPYFGLDGIKAFSWRWSRVIFTYGEPEAKYVGARFVFTVRVF